MTKKTNLKAVPDEADKLTWKQINLLASDFADTLMEKDVDASPLILLVNEISSHPFDHSHVETIANLLEHRLIENTTEAAELHRRVVRELRAKLGKGGEGR